jgi:pyruvate/2-oxoglutarate dehydrogenase complex dihydrolipoamide dehydrogenase (E3) component
MRRASSAFDFDVAIIGGGSGGYAAARTTSAAGLKTVVIEGGEEVGGLCILRGCMPTKALLYAAEVGHLARRAATWGVRASDVAFDFAAVMARKRRLVDDFAGHRAQQLREGKFEFIRAQARFTDPHTLVLSNGATLTAGGFVISSGSIVSPPPLPQLANLGCLTSDTALTLTQPPKSLIVLGGGPIAVEFAQFFARCDVRVTLIQRGAHLLKSFDTDASAALEKVLAREGIELFTGTKLLEARREGAEKVVGFEHQGQRRQARAEDILFALGRSPNTASLDLRQAGVATERGRITTNARLQTSAAHIYAAGDCTGPYEIVHIAIQQGEIAGHNLSHPERPRGIDYRLLLSVVFTEPQVATVGLTEQEARARGIEYHAASYPFNDHGKSMIMEALDGFVKLLCHPQTGEILGGGCVGPVGGELIHPIVIAMAKRMTVQELAATPHYHPTLAEIWTYPSEELAAMIGPSEGGQFFRTTPGAGT